MLDRIVTTNPKSITSADKGAMLLCNGALVGGYVPYLTLPLPADFGAGFVGFMKDDELSNPVICTPPTGVTISGWEDLWLMLKGDSYIIGCDGEKYVVMNFSQPVRTLLPIHRTFTSSLGAEVYTVKKSDRCALIRVDPRVCHAAIQLPPRTGFGYPSGGYRNTFIVGVQKVQPTANYVEVRPYGQDQINNMGNGVPYRIDAFNDCVVFDNDSNEWKVIGRYP